MQAVLSENTTQGSLRASEEIARHCTADVLVGNYSGQNPHALPTKASPIRISSQALSHSRTKGQVGHHIDESLVQRAVRDAVVKTGLTKRATCHTSQHSLATHLLEGRYDIRAVHSVAFPPSFPRRRESRAGHCQPPRASWIPAFAGMTPQAELPARDPVDRYRYLNVRELLGNDDVKTTMIYTHVLNQSPAGVRSPVDRLRTESFMPNPIRRHDKSLYGTQMTEVAGINAVLLGRPTACYADRKWKFRILYGSIQSLLAEPLKKEERDDK